MFANEYSRLKHFGCFGPAFLGCNRSDDLFANGLKLRLLPLNAAPPIIQICES